jgi:hypothetical protein
MNARIVSRLALSSLALLAAGTAAALPRVITSPVERVFVPLGFDDNDAVEVVLHGHFPSSCYKTGDVSATVDEATRTVTIEATSYLYDGARCASMMVPFTQTAQLGLVKVGTYTVVVDDQPLATAPSLVVAAATTDAPDDYLYAPVSEVGLASGPAGVRTLRLAGEYPLMLVGCMSLSAVRTWLSPGGTLVALPIAELLDDAACAAGGVGRSFDVTTEIPDALPDGEYLIHVRSLSGSSLNRVVDLEGP